MTTFSKNLLNALEKTSMTQKELAEQTNITPATISRYISGQRSPSAYNAKKISEVLGIAVDELLDTSLISTVKALPSFNPSLTEVNTMLSQRLKQLRVDSNLTQEDLSKKLNITRGTYAHYELGRREPNYETLKQIARFYNVSTDYILGRTNVKELNTTSANESVFIPTLNQKDEKDIAKKLQEILDSMNSNKDLLLYNNSLDDETRELIIASIERTLRQAKLIAKAKYTPTKYRK